MEAPGNGLLVIHKAFTDNKELIDRLIIVFFAERTKNDWIPAGFDERRIFQLDGGKIRGGDQVEDYIKGILLGKIRA